MINGMKLTVPLNTAQALGSVRMGLSQLRTQSDQSEEARIWIDAVCINQADHKERAEQVFKMKDIYENAAAVIICLGEHASPDEAEAALGSVHDIYETAMHWYGGAVSPLADTNSIAGMLSATHPSDEDYRYDLFSSVAAVFKSPWFERLWTIQESGFARKAWCILGSGVIPLYEIGVVANVMTTPLYNNMSEALRDIAHGLELANAREKFRSLESSGLFFPAIKTFMGYSASDPRDMVYAVLSLIRQNCYPVPTVVDYTCSVQELFARVTVQSIILSQSLEPLQIAALQSEDGTNDGFPSWAMRLDRGKKMTLDPLRPQFEASMSGGPWVRGIHEMPLLTRWKTLRLEGAILDEVAYAQQLDCHPNFADIRFIDSIFSIHSAISDADAAKATESSGNHPGSSQLAIKLPFWQWPETEPWNDLLVNSVARTLAAGLYADNENRVQLNVKYIENGQRYLSEYRDKRALIEPSCIYGSVCKKMGLSFPKTKSFQRAFFITKEGRLGLGPLGTIPGDQVSVFCGGHVPFVLRQKEESWRLVGDAYVHDLDHVSGELWYLLDHRLIQHDNSANVCEGPALE